MAIRLSKQYEQMQKYLEYNFNKQLLNKCDLIQKKIEKDFKALIDKEIDNNFRKITR